MSSLGAINGCECYFVLEGEIRDFARLNVKKETPKA